MMPDPSNDANVSSASPDVAAPAAQPLADAKPNPPPAQPAASTPAPATPNLDPNTTVEIPRADGSGYDVATLQDLATTWQKDRQNPLDPAEVAKFKAFNAATGGGAKEAHDLVDLFATPESATPEPTTQEQVTALQEELKTTRALVDAQSPVFQQIENARVQNSTKGLIEQHAEALPFLAKDAAEGARLVVDKLREFRVAAKAQGMTDAQFDNHPRAQEILALAMRTSESGLQTVVKRFAGFDPTAEVSKTNGKAADGVVDDQKGGPASAPGSVPARFKVSAEGHLVDAQGVVGGQNAWGGRVENIPAQPLVGEPSGTAVGPEPGQRPSGPLTMEGVKGRMQRTLDGINAE